MAKLRRSKRIGHRLNAHAPLQETILPTVIRDDIGILNDGLYAATSDPRKKV
jgi:hypothetical protein